MTARRDRGDRAIRRGLRDVLVIGSATVLALVDRVTALAPGAVLDPSPHRTTRVRLLIAWLAVVCAIFWAILAPMPGTVLTVAGLGERSTGSILVSLGVVLVAPGFAVPTSDRAVDHGYHMAEQAGS